MLAHLALLLPVAAPSGLQSPGELPFERLGGALLEAAAELVAAGRVAAGQAAPGEEAGGTAEQAFLRRLEPLCVRVDLGALEIWLPLRVVDADGGLKPARTPKEWKAVAADLLALERRWCAELGELAEPDGRNTGRALDDLESWLRRAPAKAWPAGNDDVRAAARAVRGALVGASDAPPLVLLVAPERPHYLALIGAAGLFNPNARAAIWLASARRSLEQPLAPSILVLALRWGPPHEDAPPFQDQPLDAKALRQHVLHGASHLLASRLAPTAPVWLNEGLALLDTATLAGEDETLCSGYSGRPATIFDGWREVPEAFFVFTRIESSPYRTGGSTDLFVDELRGARGPDGFEVLDLDRGRVGLVASGPFLGQTARVPEEARIGPHGLKEGFAEFFRAYSGAFAAWLAQRDADGVALLDRTLRALRERAAEWQGEATRDLEEILGELTGLTLGASLDPGRDLEGQFQAWLQERR